MKFKTFYNDGLSGGGETPPAADIGGDTPPTGEPGTDTPKGGIFSGTNVDTPGSGDNPNQEPTVDQPPATDYGFNQLESYESMPEYFNTLTNTFSELGLSQDQANKLIEVGDGVLKPLIENYENKLAEFSNERWSENIEAEKAQFTPAERQMAERIEQQVNATFSDQADRDAFGALFATRQEMALLQKFMSGLKPGANENAINGGFSGQPKGKMTYNEYETQYNKILATGNVTTIDKEHAELDKLAMETGNKELLDYLKLSKR